MLPGLFGVICRFHNIVEGAVGDVLAFYKNDAHVQCATPSNQPPGESVVLLSLNDGRNFELGVGAGSRFHFYNASLHLVYPVGSSLAGGVLVTLSGSGFDVLGGLAIDVTGRPFGPRCKFGANSVQVTSSPELNAWHAVCGPAKANSQESFYQSSLSAKPPTE